MPVLNQNIVTGYNPLDFEKRIATFLNETFQNLTIPDPVTGEAKKINIYESEFPERDVKKRNELSPYCIAQFCRYYYSDESPVFVGRVIISTYGNNTSINRQNNEIIGGHIVNKLIENPLQSLNPFTVYSKGKYRTLYQLVEQQPTSLYIFGFVQFFALPYLNSNIQNIDEILQNIYLRNYLY